MQNEAEDGQITLFGQDFWYGKMSPEFTPAERDGISKLSSRRSSALKNHTLMLLDLRPGAGNMLGPCWEYDPPWLGLPGTPNTSECPKGVVESFLSQILLDTVPSKYYLTPKACLGILRRSRVREKRLPSPLEAALKLQAGVTVQPDSRPGTMAFHLNQRDEAIDLGDVSGALMATQNMQMQTFVVSEPLAEKEPNAEMDEESRVLCLNDQGGSMMECTENMTGTLRAQEHGHQPLVFENHGIDARYTGPHAVAPTISARCGTGGNNLPLVAREPCLCITGNAIDRQPQNGGNGIGYQAELAYTLTATDHHAVYSRQRTDRFREDSVAATQSARQYKDATDLVCQPYQQSVGALTSSDAKGINSQYVSQDKVAAESPRLIRRLVPVECERLQGFPDGWTGLPGASDSQRYKALGNSVAIPCVECLMQGMGTVLTRMKEGDPCTYTQII